MSEHTEQEREPQPGEMVTVKTAGGNLANGTFMRRATEEEIKQFRLAKRRTADRKRRSARLKREREAER